MKKIIVAVILWPSLASAQPLPQPKSGQCPSGYTSSASYCVPAADAKVCVPKQGQCPSNFFQSGNYCCKGG